MKVAGQWRYVYRAIDQFGQVVDVFLSLRRDTKAARRFFAQHGRLKARGEGSIWLLSAEQAEVLRVDIASEKVVGVRSRTPFPPLCATPSHQRLPSPWL